MTPSIALTTNVCYFSLENLVQFLTSSTNKYEKTHRVPILVSKKLLQLEVGLEARRGGRLLYRILDWLSDDLPLEHTNRMTVSNERNLFFHLLSTSTLVRGSICLNSQNEWGTKRAE